MPARTTSRQSGPSIAWVLVNGMLFNASWLAIVYSHSPRLAPAIVALHLLIHFVIMGRGLVEARLVLGVSLVGFALDQLMFSVGILTVPGPYLIAPLWISCLWPVLATTLMHAFSSFQNRLVMAAIVGGVGGTASYLAGARLSDVEFVSQVWGPLTMAIVWAGLFPALLLGARLNEGQTG